MSKTKGSPQPAQGDETQREQWWGGEDNKRKVVRFYVRVMTDTLDKLRRDTQHRLDEIMKEYTITEQDLTSSMVRIEWANLYNLIQDQLK